MGTPTLTVVMAHGGTEADGTSSFAGHMYYVLTDTNGATSSYGFAPDDSHTSQPFAPGEVYTNDNTNYAGLTAGSTTVNISQAQYDALTNFGTPGNPAFLGEAGGFSSQYNFLTNGRNRGQTTVSIGETGRTGRNSNR